MVRVVFLMRFGPLSRSQERTQDNHQFFEHIGVAHIEVITNIFIEEKLDIGVFFFDKTS